MSNILIALQAFPRSMKSRFHAGCGDSEMLRHLFEGMFLRNPEIKHAAHLRLKPLNSHENGGEALLVLARLLRIRGWVGKVTLKHIAVIVHVLSKSHLGPDATLADRHKSRINCD